MGTKKELIAIINSTVEGIDLTEEQADADLTEKGMDSIFFIQTVVRIEETFGCEIPDSKLLMGEMNTLNKMLYVLKEIGVYEEQ